MEDLCKQCGKCCQAIISVHSTSEHLRKHPGLTRKVEDYTNGKLSAEKVAEDDGLFAIINFVEITKDEAIKVNPHLVDVFDDTLHFYKCRQLDPKTKLCKIHDGPRAGYCHYSPLYNMTLKEYVDMDYMDWYIPDCNFARVWEERKAKVLDAREKEVKIDYTGIDEHCKRCGKCCEVIAMNVPMKNYPAHFKPITEDEAFRLNPHLKEIGLKDKHYYSCSELDPETKLCRIYEKRPAFCRKYPHFGDKEIAELLCPDELYIADCGIVRELRRRCFGSEEL